MDSALLPFDMLMLIGDILFETEEEETWTAFGLTCWDLYNTTLQLAGEACDACCDELVDMVDEEAARCRDEHRIRYLDDNSYGYHSKDSLGRYDGVYSVRAQEECEARPQRHLHQVRLEYTRFRRDIDIWAFDVDNGKREWKIMG
jgi:hypothetical protein